MEFELFDLVSTPLSIRTNGSGGALGLALGAVPTTLVKAQA